MLDERANRRLSISHPGPDIVREYVAPLALDAATLARHVGLEDPAPLIEMLAGRRSIDVETAIRLGRALQISPVAIMERMNRYDFRAARSNEALETIPAIGTGATFRFPDSAALRGSLVGLTHPEMHLAIRLETLGFIADPKVPDEDIRARSYDLRPGSLLRVFAPDGSVAWSGPVLFALDGKPIFPAARPSQWVPWFTANRRAAFVPAA